MEFKELEQKALDLRAKFAGFEKEKFGSEWSSQEIYLGLVGDVGDLGKYIMAKEGRRDIEGADEKLPDELMDCLWSIIILAQKFNVDIEPAFEKMLSNAEEWYNLKKSK